MRYEKVKKILLFWCLFISFAAFYGGILMLIDPTGKLLQMDEMINYFQDLPFSGILFQNYVFSGIALIIVNGISNLIAAILIMKNKKIGIILGAIFGFTLMLWITIQFIIFPMNYLSTSFFVLGFLQLILGFTTYVFYTQEHFEFNKTNYKNINIKSDTIVVFFSRMGYTRKIAYEIANEKKCAILELKTPERTENTLGFLWCGRFGMHKWPMKINDINIDLKKYEKVVIVSPIWVFDICAPIRKFIMEYKNDINNVEYVFTHFMKAKFINVANNLDKIIGIKRDNFKSICVRFGNIKKVYKLN